MISNGVLIILAWINIEMEWLLLHGHVIRSIIVIQ